MARLSPLERDSLDLLEAEDPELEAIKAKIREMEKEDEPEKEDERFQGMQTGAKPFVMGPEAGLPFCSLTAEKVEADHRSIYVGNVDYEGSAEELESHFNSCGEINRVTILCDKFSGHPKGYAYIEFADRRSVQAAVGLDETTFRGRIIKVHPKRTNMPGISTTDRGGFRGRFHSRGGPPQRGGFCRSLRSRPHGRVSRLFGAQAGKKLDTLTVSVGSGFCISTGQNEQ
ncbi:PREDICTED: embryonic polyadenylate-binding protein 2-like [Gekko japonicus]|uniref:Embryonic polyadenylate-binding protein 2-like n=1 Tax=Gekko japonicus TaxID=146911 RepID=A0ABM1L615_GEKJA|nr:PREDICTED: embryonic polyadenylate-binding protein 2-like [Gekko japonicus]